MMNDPQLSVALAAVAVQAAPSMPGGAKRKRAKVFTVHGTFDNEAGWDNWDPDKKRPDGTYGLFVNRLQQELGDRDIVVEKEDHTQYNWSGGNSHDERRIAAIGLKKLIEDELSKTYATRGPDYYDGGVYVVGHSHGGTVARLAMNLWDKPSNYHEPIHKDTIDEEVTHDDTCPTCKRDRHGLVGPNTVPRPDRVITFGSPFVTFEQRRGSSLLSTYIGVWTFRLLALVPLIAGYLYMASSSMDQAKGKQTPVAGTDIMGDTLVEVAVQLALPLVLFWLVAIYLPGRALDLVQRFLGNGNLRLYTLLTGQALKAVGIAAMAVFYAAYLYGAWSAGAWTGGWVAVAHVMPVIEAKNLDDRLYWLLPFIGYWLLAIYLPGRYLAWIRKEVAELRRKLPGKYDPPEEKPVAYLNYHTPGDEAGIHLRNFGAITWLVQTLSYAVAAILVFGALLALFIGIETLLWTPDGGTILSRLGISAWSSEKLQQDRFIRLVDLLTFYPATVWAWIGGGSGFPVLGALENKYDVVKLVPQGLLASVAKQLFLTMPLAFLALGLASFVNSRLRGSGKVFGSEKASWTMASRIGVSRRANANSMLRSMFITPEAWRNGELAHCYYYKSDAVTKDIADQIADPSRHVPNRALPIEAWTAATARWLLVVLLVLGIFAAAVPQAMRMEENRIKAEAEKAAKAEAAKTVRAAPLAASR